MCYSTTFILIWMVYVTSFYITSQVWAQDMITEEIWQFGYGQIADLIFFPDGESAWIASSDGKMREWDIKSGEVIRTIRGHTGGIDSVAVSPNKEQILTGGNDGTARLWDTLTGEEIHCFEHHARVRSVAFSPDGTLILTGGDDGTARLWEISTGREILQYQHKLLTSVAFSPDGTQALTAGWEGLIILWEVASGQKILQFEPKGYIESVKSVKFSSNGAYALTDGLFGRGGGIRLWDISSGKEVYQFEGLFGLFSPDGTMIVTGDDSKVRFWNIVTGQEIRNFDYSGDFYYFAAYSPDGNYLLTARGDGSVRLWEESTGKEIHQFKGYSGVGQTFDCHSGNVSSVAFSPDVTQILTGSSDTTARLWDLVTGKEIQRFDHDYALLSASFSPDGSKIVTSGWCNIACLWDVLSGQVIQQFKHDILPWVIISAAFSPNGALVLTNTFYDFRVLDANTGCEIYIHLKPYSDVYPYIFSLDGTQVFSIDYKTARFWDVFTGQVIRQFEYNSSGNTVDVNTIVLSADGSKIFIGDYESVRILNADTGQVIRLLPQCQPVYSIACSPDGKYLLTSGDITKLWDITTGQEILRIDHNTWNCSVAISPDGTKALTGGSDGTARLWDISDITNVDQWYLY